MKFSWRGASGAGCRRGRGGFLLVPKVLWSAAASNSFMLQVIKRFIMHSKKTAFIVEHDFIMATYLADRVIVYDGQPSKRATARKPQSLLTGMNAFLKTLDITFRRDPTNYRPRIYKAESTKDREQKLAGTFYYLDE